MNKLRKLVGGIGGRRQSKELNSDRIATTSSATASSVTKSSVSAIRPIQNFCLVWLDSDINDGNTDDSINTIINLRQIVNTVTKFTDIHECIQFMNSAEEEKVFMIWSADSDQTAISLVHDMDQVNSIYILCKHKSQYKQSLKEWPKVKGVYRDIASLGKALKPAAQDCDQNSISISVIKTTDGAANQNFNQLDPCFMYSQILKEILLTIDFQQTHINEFLTFCRAQLAGNEVELKNVDLIEEEYYRHQPIWWYTYHCFLYSMLNRALRIMDVSLIIKMGFFVRDLHNHIVTLHSEQYGGNRHSKSFTVYRGQGLSQTDFDRLKNTKGGLLSFNNFLSTSNNRDVSLEFAQQTMSTSNLVGVLFIMKIDPTISATSFANVANVSYFQEEEEILFSMNSVFRIEQVNQIDDNDRLWQVDLILTGVNDPQLHSLMEHIREETFPKAKGWYRLGNLLVKLGQFNKAQEVFDVMLDQTTEESERAHIYHMIGMAKDNQEKYDEAIAAYEETLRIYNSIRSSNIPDITTTYNNIANVYNNKKDYPNAVLYYEKALNLQQKIFRANDPTLAITYNNIGTVYDAMGEYSKALSSHEKALKIKRKSLPANHPNLATSYHNIGIVYHSMNEYTKALSYYERALDIFQRSLPADHPNLETVRQSMKNAKMKQTLNDFHGSTSDISGL